MAILDVKDLSFRYPLCGEDAVKNISFSLSEGELSLICGAGGSGKSTLMRCLKKEVTPNGGLSGKVIVGGRDASGIPVRESASLIGYVDQNCEQQIVTDKVWHELAFGLESVGADKSEIALRIAETSAYFGLNTKLSRDTASLSGGEKQLLNLASVMIMRPKILLLDEPTSQLDPIAARNFTETVRRLNRDYGTTVLIAEHRLDNILPYADRILFMEDGELSFCEEKSRAFELAEQKPDLLRAMPAPVRIASELALGDGTVCDVNSARRAVINGFDNEIRSLSRSENKHRENKALELKDISFRYERNGEDIIKGLDLCVYEGECFALLGANGSGKSTVLGLVSGALRAQSGKISIFGKKIKDYKNNSLYMGVLSMLPQDVTTLFLRNTVREELEDSKITDAPFGFDALGDKHPYDLSGGEQQLLALAKVLAVKPKLLLLDEPTKSLDAEARERLCGIVNDLKAEGVTVLIVSHDTEFCAECADRCAMICFGQATPALSSAELLSENEFFTTSAARISRGYFDKAVTAGDVIGLCRKNKRKD